MFTRNTQTKVTSRKPNPDDSNKPTIQEQISGVPVVQVMLIAMLSTIAGAIGTAGIGWMRERFKRDEEEKRRLEAELVQAKASQTAVPEGRPPRPEAPPGLQPYDGEYRSAGRPVPTPGARQYTPDELANWEATLRAWESRLNQREMA